MVSAAVTLRSSSNLCVVSSRNVRIRSVPDDSKKARDRDVLNRATPPRGVQAQISPPVGEQWPEVEDTGIKQRVPTKDRLDDTPVGMETLEPEELERELDERMRARVKKTATTVDTLRMEMNNHVTRLDKKFDDGMSSINVKIDANTSLTKSALDACRSTSDQVGDLRKVVLDAVSVDRRIVREEDHWKTKTVAEVTAHEQKARIDDQFAKKKWWRELSLKTISAGLGLLGSGAVIGWVVTHLSC